MSGRPDEIMPLYRAIKLAGLMAVFIFAAGTAEFLSFEPPGQATGTVARISGVYAYNPSSGAIGHDPEEHFARDQAFAAVVDWSSIPATTVVAARWFDAFGEVVGQVGPAPAGGLHVQEVPVALPRGLTRSIPGTYLFVVERMSHGQAVEVLARRVVQVDRS